MDDTTTTNRLGRNAAYFLLASERLAQALHLPKGCHISDLSYDYYLQEFRVYIEGPGLPWHFQGAMPVELHPLISWIKNEDGTVHETWNWNLPPQGPRGE